MLYFTGHYQYAICIDLVTTCWDKRNFSQADAVDQQEIIGKCAVNGRCPMESATTEYYLNL